MVIGEEVVGMSVATAGTSAAGFFSRAVAESTTSAGVGIK
jgi:hypothetical protein